MAAVTDVAAITAADTFIKTMDAEMTVEENAAKIVQESGRTDGTENGKESGKTGMTGIGVTAVDAEMNSHQGQCRRHLQDRQDRHLKIVDVINSMLPRRLVITSRHGNGYIRYPHRFSSLLYMKYTKTGAASITG